MEGGLVEGTHTHTTTNPAVVEYLSTRKTRDVLRFLISHLAVSKPADPVAFLSDLLQRAVRSRGHSDAEDEDDGGVLDETLSLFQTRHIEAMFDAMDPFRKGVVSFIQYHNGMCTMGLVDYDREPHADANGNVTKETFVREA